MDVECAINEHERPRDEIHDEKKSSPYLRVRSVVVSCAIVIEAIAVADQLAPEQVEC